MARLWISRVAVRRINLIGKEEMPYERELEVLDDDDVPALSAETAGMKPSAARVLNVLRTTGRWMDKRDIGDDLAKEGHPLKARTILDATQVLEQTGLIERDDRFGNAATLFRAHLGGGNAP